MNKQRRLIGVFLSQPDDYYQSHVMVPLLKCLFKLNYDAAVFCMSVKSDVDENFARGDANIFNIVNYDLLDAVIILPDTLKMPGVADKLISEINAKFNGPKVSIDMDAEGFVSVCADDEAAVCALTDHLIDVHKFTDIAMITGSRGHLHAINRANGYLRSMEKHGFSDKTVVYYGDFWFTDGEKFINDLIDNGKLKYQAVVCCSIQSAVGVCEALRKRGFSIPEDIAVVCHDLNESTEYDIPICGTVIDTEGTAYRAADYIAGALGDREVSLEKQPIQVIVNKSCGCEPVISHDTNYVNKDMNFQTDFHSTHNFMMEELISDNNIDDFNTHANWYSYQLGDVKMFSICLCTDWMSTIEEKSGYRVEGYSDKIEMQFLRQEGVVVKRNVMFDKSEMVPWLFKPRSYPTAVYFSPIHFYDRCFGYAAASYGAEPVVYSSCFRAWMRNLSNALESLRMRNNLRIYSDIMRRNANTDALTGIGNRLSFDAFSINIARGTKITMIIGDLNRLKYINDTFGHIEGDYAIKTSAEAFSEAAATLGKNIGASCFRYGGDEFVLVSIGDSVTGDDYMNYITDCLSRQSSTDGKPYDVSVTMGASSGVISENLSFDELLSVADAQMLNEKKRRHTGRM